MGLIGRQAPVKRCLARCCETFVSQFPGKAHPKVAFLETRIDQRLDSNVLNGRWSQSGRSELRHYKDNVI
jgi:hypothetical protein